MPSDWLARLYVRVITDDGEEVLTPIIDMNPTFNTPHTPEHSLEADNRGASKGNDTFTFTLTCKAIRDVEAGYNPAKFLTDIQLKHKYFQIVMQERKTQASNPSGEWAFQQNVVLEKCLFNSSSPSRSTPNASPVAVFNAMALGVTVDEEYYNGTLPLTT